MDLDDFLIIAGKGHENYQEIEIGSFTSAIKIQFLSLLISNNMSWKLSEIYEALNKKFENTKDLKLNRISIDSRKINKNDFFIPISGKSFDGHNFIDEVSNLGVKACLVEKRIKKV